MARRPQVVNLHDCRDFGRPGDVYVGRDAAYQGQRIEGSLWANPFILTHESLRDEVLERYARYIDGHLSTGTLRIEDLRGARRLGCWCAPRRCHADYLAYLISRLPREAKTCRVR
jgi:hypothetical protein